MIVPPAHWSPEIHHAAQLSPKERIGLVKVERWVGYPLAQRVLKNLEDLLRHPKRFRMPCLLVVAEPYNGKTTLLQHFAMNHEPYESPAGDHVVVLVMMIQAPPTPDESAFLDAILHQLFAPYKTNDRIGKKRLQVIDLLKAVELRLLIIDEVQHLLAGSMNRQRAFLNVLKYLSTELQIPLVAAGPVEANRAIDTDPQMKSRFDRVVLTKWDAESTDSRRLVASIEALLPLMEPSLLSRPGTTRRLIEESEGTIGALCALLEKAAVKALETGKECIDDEVLAATEWMRPSKNREQAILVK